MTLFDASALLSLVLGQPAEAEVDALLRYGDCAIPAACLAEVVDKLVRRRRVEPSTVAERLGPLIDQAIAIVPADLRIAWRAGEIRGAHYDRESRAISLADCLLLASATSGDEIATCDGAVVATARDLDIGVIPLPSSEGGWPQH